jgi:membrane protein YqaA with SNARE-associated domain
VSGITLQLARLTHLLVTLLKPLGFWGAGAIALLDSSTIPVPMDVILATYMWNDRPHAWVYVLMGAAGSAIGGLLPFLLGRAGGEIFLLKRIDRARYEKIRDRFERQEFLALLVPSMLPPPTPWKLFVFAAGVFEMRIAPYLLAVFLGRLVRFGVLAVLTLRYGPAVVGEFGRLAHQHARGMLTVLGVLLAALLVYAIRKGLAHRASLREARTGEFAN